jgi:AraC family transcriptional regulator of adaptative response/methylated-DNA-[protein]-cysteine methyltransferase
VEPTGEKTADEVRIRSLNRACAYLEENLDRDVSLEELGSLVGWSPSHLQRVFRERLGVSPREYVEALRIGLLKQELRGGVGDVPPAEGDSGRAGVNGGGITRALLDAGFGSNSTGHEASLRHLGMTPATYGAGGLGARIEYRAVNCSLGWIMVGRTSRGVCSTTLGDDPHALLEALADEFPQAELVEGGETMAALCERLVGIADRGEDGRDLPVEVVATEFQWRVWRAMREIPRGETRSYSQLAEMAGNPAATRAAASACANNRVSLLIPCHRVVRADGSTGRYAWGDDRKVKLLAAEADAVASGGGKRISS